MLPVLLNGLCDLVLPYLQSCSQPHRKGSDYLDKDVRLSVWRADSSIGAQYCCGDANTTQTNSSLACIDGSPAFTLPDATPLLGVAGLSNAQEVSSTNSTSNTADTSTSTPTAINTAYSNDCSSQKKDTITVGSVLGVALLAVAIALIIWAVWERRQKVLWWQRATGLGPNWPPNNAPWMRAGPIQKSKPPPCPVARAKLLYASHQEQKRAQEQAVEQPAPTYGAHQLGSGHPDPQQPMSQTQISSPQSPREMPDGMPAAAEMDAT